MKSEKKLKFLSSCKYKNQDVNYGDCIIINCGGDMLVYDCGSVEHAVRVMEVMSKNGISKIDCVLSHNDLDHFAGIKYLVDNECIERIYTVNPFAHIKEIKSIFGNRLNEKVIEKRLAKEYSNIHSVLDYVVDIYDNSNNLIPNDIITGFKVVAPNYDYAMNCIAKCIDTRESNVIDGESLINSPSVCLYGKCKESILLTGDSSFDNIVDNLSNVNYIQLPHHGKEEQANELIDYFDKNGKDVTYLVSNNTGENRDSKKMKYKKSKDTSNGDFEIDLCQCSCEKKGTFGVNEMLCRK